MDHNLIFIEFEFTKTLKYFKGLLQISHPSMHVNVQPKTCVISIQANGSLTLAGTNFIVSIAKDYETYFKSAFTHSVSISTIITSFSANVLPGPVQSLVGKIPFLNFGINDSVWYCL